MIPAGRSARAPRPATVARAPSTIGEHPSSSSRRRRLSQGVTTPPYTDSYGPASASVSNHLRKLVAYNRWGQVLVEPPNVKTTGHNRSATDPIRLVIFYVSDPETPFLDPI